MKPYKNILTLLLIFVFGITFALLPNTSFAAAPSATNLSAAETYTEDTALNLVDIVVSDIDSANVVATLTLSSPAAGSLSTATSGAVTSTYNAGMGVWTASGTLADVNTLLAGVTFTPAANYNSSFTVATNISDGVDSVSGAKTFTGIAVNDAPTLDSSKSPVLNVTDENSQTPVGAMGTLVSSLVDGASPAGQVDNIADVDSGASMGIAITASDSNLTCFYTINGGVSWNALGAVSSASARLLAANSNTRFFCHAGTNVTGVFSTAITFRAWDQTSGVNGGLASTIVNGGTSAFSTTTDTASLVVANINSTPIAVDDSYDITENASLTGFFLLTNDVDWDGDAMSIISITSPSHGSASIDGTGEYILYIPDANFSGADTLTYTITDTSGAYSTATITITIHDTSAPTIVSVTPTDGTIGSAVDVPLVITFSEPMETSSLAVSTGPCGNDCPTYDIVWSAGDTVATLTKSNGLFEPDTEYTVTIASTTNDVGGNDLASDYTWSFSTYIPLVLTEVTPIPSRTKSRNPVYYFSTNEDVADYGEFGYMAESCNSEDDDNSEVIIDPVLHTFTIKNAKVGNTYECSFQLASTLRGTSNMLLVGPFTVVGNTTSGGMAPRICTDEKASNYKLPNSLPCQYTQQQVTSLASNTNLVINRTLKFGTTGQDVKALQTYLNAKNFIVTLAGKETTYFGAKTKAAVIQFQKAHNLLADGIVGPKTLLVMNGKI